MDNGHWFFSDFYDRGYKPPLGYLILPLQGEGYQPPPEMERALRRESLR